MSALTLGIALCLLSADAWAGSKSVRCRHVVRKGDILGRIARTHGVRVATLLRWNGNLKKNALLQPGQVLHLRKGGCAGPRSARTYVVRAGDTLKKIAKRTRVTVAALRRANPRLANPHKIRVGQRIRLPSGALPQQRRSTHHRAKRGLIFSHLYSVPFAKEVRRVAKRLKMNPNHLLAVIHYETNGTFSPRIRNPSTGAVGLIQFLPRVARELGTSTTALRKMSATQQLRWVARYLRPFRGRMKTVDSAYLAVFYPAAMRKRLHHVVYRKGSKTYRKNRIHDRNRDGRVTKREIVSGVRERYHRGRKST